VTRAEPYMTRYSGRPHSGSSRRYGERDARVAAEVSQLPLIRQRPENDYVALNPNPRSCDVGGSSVIVECDHVRHRIALEKLSRRRGGQIAAIGEWYFVPIPRDPRRNARRTCVRT
jgi:hypothetical protein